MVALGWLCSPESMPSICLVYGFGVALGAHGCGFGTSRLYFCYLLLLELTSLDHTIREGNSVISDPAVQPKAFDPGKRSRTNAKAQRCKDKSESAVGHHHLPGESFRPVLSSPSPCSLRLCLLASLR